MWLGQRRRPEAYISRDNRGIFCLCCTTPATLALRKSPRNGGQLSQRRTNRICTIDSKNKTGNVKPSTPDRRSIDYPCNRSARCGRMLEPKDRRPDNNIEYWLCV